MTTTRRVAAVLFPLCVLAGNSTAGTIIDLGTFGGFTSYATGISANGKVTGAADLADGTTHAFLYSGGSKIDLGALGTGQNSVGTSVNSAGVVTGSSGDTTSSTAIEYSGGTLSAMGVVPANSVGKAINENGEVAGVTGFSDPGYNSRGFLYTGGQLVTLNPYGGGRELTTTGLNNSGEVVGYERGANF